MPDHRSIPRTDHRQNVTRRRWQAIGLIVTLVAIGWLIANHANSHDQRVTVVNSQATASSTLAAPSPTTQIAQAPRPGRDVSWRVVAGMDLPISRTAGPYCLTSTRASCFAHTPDGAAVAAAQLLVRTFPFTGTAIFEPTIAEQVTGDGAPALARLTKQTYEEAARAAGVRGGAPIRSSDGWIAGYRLGSTTEKTTSVQVLVIGDGENLGFTAYSLQLTWQDGDWRLTAPAWGDWRSLAHPVANPYPASYRSYDNLGLGTGGAS